MKKFAKLCTAILVLFAVLTVSALAAEVLYSGTCSGEGDGSNLTWTLDDEGTLRIEGKGRMKDYNWRNGSPWYNYRSSVKSVVIGEGVTSIGWSAFSGCSSLTLGTIPESVTSIGGYAFYGCSSLMSATIPEGVTGIEWQTFYACSSLTSVTIPSSVTSIGREAFRDCSSLASVSIPSSVTSIGESAFCNCSNLKSVYITDLAAWCKIEFSSYDSNPLCSNCAELYINGEKATNIEIPTGVTSIGSRAFEYCRSLTSVTIPEGVTSIGRSAFYNCSNLTSVTIPSSVTSIDSKAFYNSDFFGNCSLKSVYITDLAAWCKIRFSDNTSNPLYN